MKNMIHHIISNIVTHIFRILIRWIIQIRHIMPFTPFYKFLLFVGSERSDNIFITIRNDFCFAIETRPNPCFDTIIKMVSSYNRTIQRMKPFVSLISPVFFFAFVSILFSCDFRSYEIN